MIKPEPEVQDGTALDEIEMYGELMIAASSSDAPLSQDQIDDILGVRPPSPRVGGTTLHPTPRRQSRKVGPVS